MKISKVQKNGFERWMVDLGKVNGRRQRRFFQDEEEAKAFYKANRFQRKNVGHEALHLSHRKRVDFLNAEERLAEVGATITDAVNFYLEHKKAVEEKPLREAIQMCLESKQKAGLRKRYIQQLGYSLKAMEWDFPDRNCSQFSQIEIEDWIHGKDWQLRTKRGRLIDLGTFFEFAKRRGWTPVNPCRGIERIRLEEKTPAILTPEQTAALFESAQRIEPGMIPYLALCTFAGLRRSEAQNIQRSEVDLERGYVEVKAEKSKTRQRRLVSLSDNCRAWLKLGGDIPPGNLRRRWARVLKEAGLLDWHKNAMRHSFCSYHLAFHGSAGKTAMEAGHSEEMLFQNYRELVKPEDAKKFWAIGPG